MADLITLRRRAGLTQSEAAQLVYRSRGTWSKYESGLVEPDRAVCELFKSRVAGIIKARQLEGL